MNIYLGLVVLVLLVSLLAGLVRVIRGPAPEARLMAGQLLGTTAVAILLVLWGMTGQSAFLDVAMVFAILAAVALVAFVALSNQEAGR
ncbi:pH regulation protein F [Paracoccus bogoriensis]|uniref:monovalent cation/H+ antiporter complex subunit F n=1 Tax=Paracoccus bogoriensis TaxID=242065 RepID=UPI001CA4FD9E|nr:monovalent cation/H+ antiporter complex subunit F [Paracoccus bogoriensis]MBW7057396.1 pH regulation protein F [Paracoccus bogoriensis]